MPQTVLVVSVVSQGGDICLDDTCLSGDLRWCRRHRWSKRDASCAPSGAGNFRGPGRLPGSTKDVESNFSSIDVTTYA